MDFTFENRRRITPTLSSVLGEAEGERIRFFMPSLNGKDNAHVSRVILHELIHGVTEYAHQAAKAGEFSDSITVNLSVAVERPQS